MASKTIAQGALKRMRLSQIEDFLEVCGIEFEIKNNGQHFVVMGPKKIVDYWPGSGKFIVRGGESGQHDWANDFCAYCMKINDIRQPKVISYE